MDKIRLIVIDEHTLGYQISETMAGVLQASVIKGATQSPWTNIIIKGKNIRLASQKDFDEFNVSMDGYKRAPHQFEFSN